MKISKKIIYFPDSILLIKYYLCNGNNKAKITSMNIGDKLPDVLIIKHNGEEQNLRDYVGNKLIIYFYPKDMTSGCTTQACSIRDNYTEFKKMGYKVVGVSIDSVVSHHKFIEKNELPFELVSDEDHQLAELFGVWGEKKLYGKTYMGTLRTTFIFDERGALVYKMNSKEVKTKNHAEQILNLITQ